MTSDNPRLDKEILEQHGITYSMLDYSSPPGFFQRFALPDHVYSLRKPLLEPVPAVCESMKPFFSAEYEEASKCGPRPIYYGFNDFLWRYYSTRVYMGKLFTMHDFEEDRELAATCRAFTPRFASKEIWTQFLHSKVFKNPCETVESSTQPVWMENPEASSANISSSVGLDKWYLYVPAIFL